MDELRELVHVFDYVATEANLTHWIDDGTLKGAWRIKDIPTYDRTAGNLGGIYNLTLFQMLEFFKKI